MGEVENCDPQATTTLNKSEASDATEEKTSAGLAVESGDEDTTSTHKSSASVEEVDDEDISTGNDDNSKPLSSDEIEVLSTTNTPRPKRNVIEPSTPSSTKKRRLAKEEIEERERIKLEKKKEREEQAEKKRLEKEQQAKQREQKRLEEEEARKRREDEKERKRLELKAREEEKERKRREEEEARKRREEEKERKRLELKAREEEKERKRLEERKAKEEELLQKRREEEELEEKKRRQAEKFKNFFVKIETPRAPQTVPAMQNPRFQPFHVKEGMRLAPLHVRTPLSASEYNALLNCKTEIPKQNYLSEICVRKRGHPLNKTEVFAVDENGVSLKVKLLQFFENYRPPYYGTWRKRSTIVTPRRPWAQENIINYDYDSDEDWEAEPSDAEECKSDDEEDAEKDEDDDEENDGFFVEHGYLSSGEGSGEEDEASVSDSVKKPTIEKVVDLKDQRNSETDDQRKHRLAQRAEEWKESQKMKVKRFKKSCSANVFGPSWSDSEEDNDDSERMNASLVGDGGDAKLLPPRKSRRHYLPPAILALYQMRVVVLPYKQLVPSTPVPDLVVQSEASAPSISRTAKAVKS